MASSHLATRRCSRLTNAIQNSVSRGCISFCKVQRWLSILGSALFSTGIKQSMARASRGHEDIKRNQNGSDNSSDGKGAPGNYGARDDGLQKALVEADGNMEEAIDSLRKSSGLKAAKKAGRIAADGTIVVKSDENGGTMVEVNCETDFAAKDENFLAFAERIASAAHAQPGTDVASLMGENWRPKEKRWSRKLVKTAA